RFRHRLLRRCARLLPCGCPRDAEQAAGSQGARLGPDRHGPFLPTLAAALRLGGGREGLRHPVSTLRVRRLSGRAGPGGASAAVRPGARRKRATARRRPRVSGALPWFRLEAREALPAGLAKAAAGGSAEMTRRSTIVLLSGNGLCNNPRVIKEAAALAGAGHEVHVLGLWLDPALKARGLRLLAGAPVRFVPA